MSGKKENLEYVDLIKGFAALSVVLLHAFPKEVLYMTFSEVHIWQAVPLFVFVSFFLIYRKMEYCKIGEYYSLNSFIKLFKKILLPFILLQLILILVYALDGDFVSIKNLIKYGGYGRGSYYIYVYIQIWLVAPLLYKLLKKQYLLTGVGLVLASIIGNYFICMGDYPTRVESCLLFRYFLLAFLSYIWYTKKDNILYRILPVVSVIYWIWLMDFDLSPWILSARGWRTQQFPALFYTLLAVFIIYKMSLILPAKIKQPFLWCGRNSYFIYIMQMLFFHYITMDYFGFINNGKIQLLLYALVSVICSIIPVICWHYVTKYIKFRSKK